MPNLGLIGRIRTKQLLVFVLERERESWGDLAMSLMQFIGNVFWSRVNITWLYHPQSEPSNHVLEGQD